MLDAKITSGLQTTLPCVARKTMTRPPRLVPVVGVPPDFLDVEGNAAAEVHRCVFLVHAKALVVLESLKRSAVVTHVIEAPLNHYEVLEELRRRSPVPMVLMARPGTRQSVPRAELINRAGFAIVARPDTGLVALVGWQRFIDGGYLTH